MKPRQALHAMAVAAIAAAVLTACQHGGGDAGAAASPLGAVMVAGG